MTIRIGNFQVSGISRAQLAMWRKLVAEPAGLRLQILK
jgi:hypothetical protein